MALSLQQRPETQKARRVRRFEPSPELEELQREMGQLLESVLVPGAGTGAGAGSIWSPLVDIEETEEAWIVEAELPGVERAGRNRRVARSGARDHR